MSLSRNHRTKKSEINKVLNVALFYETFTLSSASVLLTVYFLIFKDF